MQKFHYLLGCPLYIFGQSEQIAAYKNNDEHIPGVNLLENSLPLHILLYTILLQPSLFIGSEYIINYKKIFNRG